MLYVVYFVKGDMKIPTLTFESDKITKYNICEIKSPVVLYLGDNHKFLYFEDGSITKRIIQVFKPSNIEYIQVQPHSSTDKFVGNLFIEKTKIEKTSYPFSTIDI